MPELEIARSLEEVVPTLSLMMKLSMPGFQVAPEVTDETAILEALSEGMQTSICRVLNLMCVMAPRIGLVTVGRHMTLAHILILQRLYEGLVLPRI